jgi:CTP:molybdopterin cytidylyltransferase MocA
MSCIILAAGDRQHPDDHGDGKLSKNLADLNGKPVIRHVVDNAIASGIPPHRITVVVKRSLASHFREVFADVDVRLAYQDVARGSADAVRLVMEQGQLAPCKHILLLMGDQPSIRPETLMSLCKRHEREQRLITVATFAGNRAHPAFKKCGVIRTVHGRFTITREAATLNLDVWLHAGPYVFLRSWLHECITHIDWEQDGEINVYRAVEAAAALGNGILEFPIADAWEALGIDTYDALEAIRRGDRKFLNL